MSKSIKKHVFLIGAGIINLLHGSLHLIQFLQSLLLVKESMSNHESKLDSFLHNPILSLVWGLIGLVTLVIGIKDFLHHKKCKHEHKI